MKNNNNYLIIGNSAAGIAAARTLRKLDERATITLVSDESGLPYNKCFLADYLAGTKDDAALITMSEAMCVQLRIQMLAPAEVMAIVSDNKQVMVTNQGTSLLIPYDRLLIATGSRAYKWNQLRDVVAQNLFSFVTYADAYALRCIIESRSVCKAVVIGAGLTGLEVADALTARGIQVTIIEQAEHPLARHMAAAAAPVLAQAIARAGAVLLTRAQVADFIVEGSQIRAVRLADGTELACDMVVVTAGMVQNRSLAEAAGIACDAYGIVVNEHLQTSVTDIYAAGDVIGIYDRLSLQRMASCTWPDAMQQGMVAAQAMHGVGRVYSGADIIVSSAFFGLKFASAGPIHMVPDGWRVVERSGADEYSRYLMDGAQLKGFVALHTQSVVPKLRRAILTQEPFQP